MIKLSFMLIFYEILCYFFNTALSSSIPVGAFPLDAIEHTFLKDPYWSYWYRPYGMQTSTDDVIIAYLASHKVWSDEVLEVQKEYINPNIERYSSYIDLGCGIGSILLLLVHSFNVPVPSLGIEVQLQSYQLSNRTIQNIGHPKLYVHHMDIREISNGRTLDYLPLLGNRKWMHNVDLITANPPYYSNCGSLSKDAQRLNARFEQHGGIEDYCRVAAELLDPINGLFIFSFLSAAKDRVMHALECSGLKTLDIVTVRGGNPNKPVDFIHIYKVAKNPFLSIDTPQRKSHIIDITRNPITGRLNDRYYRIQSYLKMAPRPLKRSLKPKGI